MYYIKRKRERRTQEADRPRRRGPRMTLASLAAAGAFIAAMKAQRPEMNIKPLVLMLCGVALGCFIMNILSGLSKKNDE